MSELDDKLEALRQRAVAASKKREQAEQEHAVAKGKEEAARSALQEEFGVSTVEEAHKMLASMEEQLAHEISAAEALLGEAESA